MKDLSSLVVEMLEAKHEMTDAYTSWTSTRDNLIRCKAKSSGENIEKAREKMLGIIDSIMKDYESEIKTGLTDLNLDGTLDAHGSIEGITLSELLEDTLTISLHIHNDIEIYTWLRDFSYYDKLLYS